jgi:hypothetical protein
MTATSSSTATGSLGGAAAGAQADTSKSRVARRLKAVRRFFFILSLPPGSNDPPLSE